MIKVRRVRYLDNQTEYLRLTSCMPRVLTKVHEISSLTRFYKFYNSRDDMAVRFTDHSDYKNNNLLTTTRHSSDTIMFRTGNTKLHSVLIV